MTLTAKIHTHTLTIYSGIGSRKQVETITNVVPSDNRDLSEAGCSIDLDHKFMIVVDSEGIHNYTLEF